jgi:hypothetical protein
MIQAFQSSPASEFSIFALCFLSQVPLSSLRSADEVMNLLLSEHADLELWHRFAVRLCFVVALSC